MKRLTGTCLVSLLIGLASPVAAVVPFGANDLPLPLVVLAVTASPALLRLWGRDYAAAWPLVIILAVGFVGGNVVSDHVAKLVASWVSDAEMPGGRLSF